MTRKGRLLKKFLKNPDSLKFRDIETILKSFNYILVRVKGSHYHYHHKRLSEKFVFPVHNNDCFKSYKRHLAKFINNKLL